MKFWNIPDRAPEQPPPAPNGEQRNLFRAVLDTLTDRRERELTGHWARAPKRIRRAKAAQRAREEMARRIAQHTGKARLSERTIARRARANKPPPGVEQVWLERWEMIDRAGGIEELARSRATTVKRIRTWRDSPDPDKPMPGRSRGEPVPPGAPPGELRVGVECRGPSAGDGGWLTINLKDYPKDIPADPTAAYATITVTPDDGIMDAWIAEDFDTLHDLLGEAITRQIIMPTFNLPPTYDVGYRIRNLRKFIPGV